MAGIKRIWATASEFTIAGTSNSWDFGGTPTNGNLVVVSFSWNGNPGTLTPTGSAWSVAAAPFTSGAVTTAYQAMLFALWDGTYTDPTTFSWTNSVPYTICSMEYSGILSPVGSAEDTPTQHGQGQASAAPFITTVTPSATGAQANELWVCVASIPATEVQPTVTDPVVTNNWIFSTYGNNPGAGTPIFSCYFDLISQPAQKPVPTVTLPITSAVGGLGLVVAFKGADAAPVNTVAPALSSVAPKVGDVVTVTQGTWTGTTPVTGFTYKWNTATNAAFTTGVTGYTITGETPNANYIKIGDNFEGLWLRCIVTATNSIGSTAANSNITTSAMAEPIPTPVVNPFPLLGLPQVGAVLSLPTNSFYGMGGVTHTTAYQWQHANDAAFTSGVTNIGTAATFTLTSTQLNKYVRVLVTATNAAGSSSAIPSQVMGPVQTTLTFVSTVTNAVLPTWKLEFSPTTNPAATPVWVDITSRLISWSSQRGRQYELDTIQAGTATVTLDNTDRALDPTNTSGIYYNAGVGLVPLRRMRLICSFLGGTYSIFAGYVEGWPQTWEGTHYATTTVTLTDAFELLANTQLLSSVASLTTTLGSNRDLVYTATSFGGGYNQVSVRYVQGAATSGSSPIAVDVDLLSTTITVTLATSAGRVVSTALDVMNAVNASYLATILVSASLAPGSTGTGVPDGLSQSYLSGGTFTAELSGDRIERVLDSMNPAWPAGDRMLDVGQQKVGPAGFGPNDGQGSLQHVQDVSASELGYVFINGAGKVVFHDSAHRTTSGLSTTSNATFGDSGTELEYLSLVPNFDVVHIRNEVKVTPGALATQTVSDATSQTRYVKRSMNRSTLLTTTAAASSQASALLAKLKDPKFRFDSMAIQPLQNLDLWLQALSREIGDRITVKRRPPDGNTGTPVTTVVCFIESVQIDLVGEDAVITWGLSNAV